MTPLILASRKGSVQTTKLLIELESNIDSKSNIGSTALIMAAIKGHEGCVRTLLAAGASVNFKYFGKTALSYALENLRSANNSRNQVVVKLLKGEAAISTNEVPERKKSKFEEMEKAAIEGYLARFFDVQEIPHALVSKVLATKITVASLENLLQTL